MFARLAKPQMKPGNPEPGRVTGVPLVVVVSLNEKRLFWLAWSAADAHVLARR